MDTLSKDVKYLLIAIRINRLALSRNKLCDKLGISVTSLYRLEKGLALPSIDTLSIYARLMKCKVCDLINAVEDNKSKYAYLVKQGKELLNDGYKE